VPFLSIRLNIDTSFSGKIASGRELLVSSIKINIILKNLFILNSNFLFLRTLF
jgi:hypothetical protein